MAGAYSMEKKSRPSVVHILGHEVKISYHRKLGGGAYQGLFFGEQRRIKVVANKNWQDTLIHEILHGIFYYSGHGTKLGDKDEEAIVVALELGLKNIVCLK